MWEKKKSALGTCVHLCPVTQPLSFVINLSYNAMLLFKKYLYWNWIISLSPSTPPSHPPSFSSVLTTLKLIASFSLIIYIIYNHKHTQTHTQFLLSSFLLSLCIWFQKLTTLHWTINNGVNYWKRLILLLPAISGCSSLSNGETPWKFSPSILRCPLRLALFYPHSRRDCFTEFRVFCLFQSFYPLFCNVPWATDVAVLEMDLWGLGSPLTALCIVYSCVFLWWSPSVTENSSWDERWELSFLRPQSVFNFLNISNNTLLKCKSLSANSLFVDSCCDANLDPRNWIFQKDRKQYWEEKLKGLFLCLLWHACVELVFPVQNSILFSTYIHTEVYTHIQTHTHMHTYFLSGNSICCLHIACKLIFSKLNLLSCCISFPKSTFS